MKSSVMKLQKKKLSEPLISKNRVIKMEQKPDKDINK